MNHQRALLIMVYPELCIVKVEEYCVVLDWPNYAVSGSLSRSIVESCVRLSSMLFFANLGRKRISSLSS